MVSFPVSVYDLSANKAILAHTIQLNVLELLKLLVNFLGKLVDSY